jgi:hypothetical protein
MEKPLAPGLQLGLSSASEVLSLHCAPELHPGLLVADADAKAKYPYPVAAIYSSLLHILGSINALYKPSLAALLALSSSEGVTPAQALPLLSGEGVLSAYEGLRLNALQACEELRCFAPGVVPDRVVSVQHFELFTQRMWIACHDSKADVSARAALIWQKFDLAIGPQYLDGLIALLTNEETVIRTAVGSSIASALGLHPAAAAETLNKMTALFVASPDQVINSNQLGLRSATEYVSRSHTRSGVAQALGACTDSISSAAMLSDLFAFFVSHGLRDMNDRVWEDVLNATLRIINQHGKVYMDTILPVLEGVLKADFDRNEARAAAASAASSKKGGKAAAASSSSYTPLTEEEEAQNDRLREGIIVSMGTLGRHMDDGPALVGVVDSLIESLRTPSHSVQKSVSECLPPLMQFQSVSDNAAKWIDLLLLRLHTGEDYGERKVSCFLPRYAKLLHFCFAFFFLSFFGRDDPFPV